MVAIHAPVAALISVTELPPALATQIRPWLAASAAGLAKPYL